MTMFPLDIRITSKNCIWIFLILCLFLDSYETLSSDFEPGGKPQTKTVTPGAEAILGAVINIRDRGPGLFGCGKKRLEGVALADALSWTVDQLNRQIWSGSSSNVSLGVHIMDSCGRTRTAASQLADFLPELREEVNSVTQSSPFRFAVIDDVGLDQEVDVSKTLEELHVPVVRTDRPDLQTQSAQDVLLAALSMIQELRWDRLAVFHSSSSSSLSMLKAMTKAMKKTDVCVSWMVNVEEAQEEELEAVLSSGLPILALLPSEEHTALLNKLKVEPANKGRTALFFTDLILRDSLKAASARDLRLFSMIPFPMKEVKFEEFLAHSSIMTGVRTEDELEMAQRTRIVRRARRIVETLSSALGHVFEDVCHEERRVCSELLTAEGRRSLSQILSKLQWSAVGGHYGLVEYQFQFPDGHVHLRKTMAFNNHNNLDVMDTNLPRVELKCEDSSENEVPECRCLQVKNMRSGAARNIDDRGSKRQQHTKHVAETDYVVYSPPEVRPVHSVHSVHSHPSVYASLRDPLNATLAGLTLLGALLTVLTAQYFATSAALPRGGLTSGTSVVGYLILIGLFLLYSTNLSFVLTASASSCGIRRIGPSFSYAVIFSGMMIKVWTSWKQTRSEKEESCRPLTLFLLSVSFSFMQALISGTWLLLVPATAHFDNDRRKCYPSGDLDSHLLVSMVYVVALVFATSVLAIRTCSRSNNSEARWILISSALVAIVFSCWGIAVATGVWQQQRTASTNVAAATILLLCLYLPKIKHHSQLKRMQPEVAQYPVELNKEYSLFAGRPTLPVMLEYNLRNAVTPEDLTESGYSNQAYSLEGTESVSIPFEIDTSSFSEPEHEPFTFSTFLDEPQANTRPAQAEFSNDPTQVVPSSLYSLEMFNNETTPPPSEHCQPGTNEFTPAHRSSGQMYLCPAPEWVP